MSKTKNIENSTLGITEQDVKEETDYMTLLRWDKHIQREIIEINQKLRTAKAKQQADHSWVMRTEAYKSLQLQLKTEIQYRMSVTRHKAHILRVEQEKQFWKSKVKALAPNLFYEFIEELESKLE